MDNTRRWRTKLKRLYIRASNVSLLCRLHLESILASRVPGSIKCKWTGTRRPFFTISMAQSVSIPGHFWLRRTTGCSVTLTALMCLTGRLQSAVAIMHRWVSRCRSCNHPRQMSFTNKNQLTHAPCSACILYILYCETFLWIVLWKCTCIYQRKFFVGNNLKC